MATAHARIHAVADRERNASGCRTALADPGRFRCSAPRTNAFFGTRLQKAYGKRADLAIAVGAMVPPASVAEVAFRKMVPGSRGDRFLRGPAVDECGGRACSGWTSASPWTRSAC